MSAESDRAGTSHERPGLATLAVGTGAAVLSLARIPTALWDSLYAEDGQVFLTGWATGTARLLQPYAGYLHLIPRAATWLVSLLPVSWWAVATTGVVCVLVGLVCALCYDAAASLVRSRAVRLAIGLTPALAVGTGTEVLGNLADFHLYCLVLLVVLSAGRPPRSLRGQVAQGALVLVLVLSEVQALALAPVVAWMAWAGLRRVGPPRPGYVIAWVLGSAAQLDAALTASRHAVVNPVPVDLVDGTRGYLFNVVLATVAGTTSRALDVLEVVGWWGPGLAVLCLCVAAAWSCRAGHDREAQVRFLPLIAIIVGAASWYASYAVNARYRFETMSRLSLLRWGAAGSMLLVIALLVVLDRAGRRPVTAVLLAVALVVSVVGFPTTLPYRRGEAPWSESVEVVRAVCQEDPDVSVHLPTPQPPGRFAVVPCSRVLGR